MSGKIDTIMVIRRTKKLPSSKNDHLMADILADHQISSIIGSVIINGSQEHVDPNGIKLCLGSEVKFHSTGEKKKLSNESFIKIKPGESVSFSSFEEIDFTNETVKKHFPECSLMGVLTPTTAMMREGNLNSSTKIDPGFKGELNWSIRNGSSRDLLIEFHEPIVKLTIYLLKGDENPAVLYGERGNDRYQRLIP